ncbi:MAG: hypothetical protein ABI471_00615 [Sphingomonas bacterium]
MIRDSRMARRLAMGASALTALVMLEGCPSTSLYNSREMIGFPITAGQMSVPDGLAHDAGWNNSFRMFLEDGSLQSASFMRGVANQDHVYLYVEAEDAVFDNTDAVIVAFNPTNANDKFMRLHIYPCRLNGGGTCPGTGDVSTSNLPAEVEFETGTLNAGTVTWSAPSQAPAGVLVRSATAPDGNHNRWSVEIQLDRATYPFLTTGTFGMFVDAIATNPGMLGVPAYAVQYSWPLGSFVGDNDSAPPAQTSIDTAALPLPRWGNATLDPTAFQSGMQITGFETTGADPSAISLTQPNEFIATVANSPMGGGGDVGGVTTDFQINNMGLHPSWTWTPIPPTPIPNTPQTIHPQEYFPFSSGEWKLATSGDWQGSGKSEHDFFADNLHQCIMVTAHSGALTASRQYNMNFVTVNSPFDVAPEIATGAWRKNYPDARGVILHEQFLNAPAGFTWQTRMAGAEPAGDHRWALKLGGNVQSLKQSVLADKTLSLPSKDYVLDAVALSRGKTVDVEVKPGSVLTLLTEGEAKIKGRVVSAAGLNDEAAKRLQIEVPRTRDILRGGQNIRTGALMGSFDGFRTSFAIGNGATLYVPAQGGKLSVRFGNGVPFDGGTFRLQVLMSAPTPVALDGASMESLRKAERPVLLPLGGNLPMHIVRGTLDVGKIIVIGKQKFPVGIPMGSYGSLIHRIGGGGGEPPKEPGNPGGPKTGLGTVTGGLSVRPVGIGPAVRATATPATRPK